MRPEQYEAWYATQRGAWIGDEEYRLIASLLAPERRPEMMYDWGNYGGWGMGFGMVFMLLFWVLVILGIAVLVRWLMTQSSPDRGAREKSPLEIVQERYARGEIDHDEYEQKKRDLET